MLSAKDRDDMGIKIKGNDFHATKSLADLIQLPEVDLCYMLSLMDRDPGKKTAEQQGT